jgi:hypothetical protein
MDTLHAYETLRSKFDEDTAKTIVGAMAGLVTPSFVDLATKTDIHDVKAGMEQLRLAMKADTAETRAELLDKMRTTTLTIVGANLTALAVATGILLKALSN